MTFRFRLRKFFDALNLSPKTAAERYKAAQHQFRYRIGHARRGSERVCVRYTYRADSGILGRRGRLRCYPSLNFGDHLRPPLLTPRNLKLLNIASGSARELDTYEN